MSRAWPVDALDPDAPLGVNARRILAVKMAEYYSYAPIVPREDAVEALHDLRIAAKRLRYTLELFRVVFGKEGAAQIDRVKEIQEELGIIHDQDVRVALIEDELAAVAREQSAAVGDALAESPSRDHAAITASAMRPPPDDPRRGLLALLGRQHGGRREHYRAFRALWDRFAAEGMRADLAALSATPLPDAPGEGPARDNRGARDGRLAVGADAVS